MKIDTGDTVIRSRDLSARDIPESTATWDEIGEFALTFDGYERPDCAEIANARQCCTLEDARTCLFFEQRRWRHFGESPDDQSMAYIRGLIEIIRFHVTSAADSPMAPGNFVEMLGNEMVTCELACEGIVNAPADGILPRCLFLEDELKDERGCIIVGLNPGRAPHTEREYYLDHGSTYETTLEYWTARSAAIPYYSRLREFVRAVGLDGPLLWTELAKCESAAGASTIPPVQTLRRCAGRYLESELQAMPHDWPVLGVGQDAFRALSFMAPSRHVLGVPHPTGSRGHFARLFSAVRAGEAMLDSIRDVLSDSEPVALWLSR